VFTTVHANNVVDVLGRFLNMGVEAYQFVSSLNCVLAQRLVRVICQQCRRPQKVTRAMLEESGIDPALADSHVFSEGAGCIECGGTGYKGRTAICELLDLSDRIGADSRTQADLRDQEGSAGGGHAVPARGRRGPRARRRHHAARDQQGDVRRMSRLSSALPFRWLTSPWPTTAVEFAARRVTVVKVAPGGFPAVITGQATEPLPRAC